MAVEPAISNMTYQGTPDTVIHIMKVAYGPHGTQSWEVRKAIEDVIGKVTPRDYWSEALAIYYWVCSPVFRYTHDPAEIELVKSPDRMIAEIKSRGFTMGDCDDLAAFETAAMSVIGVPSRIATVGFRESVVKEIMPDELAETYGFKTSGSTRVSGPFSHVFVQARHPNGSWVSIDPVAGRYTREMHRRIKQARFYEV